MKKPIVHVSHDLHTLRKQLTTQLFFTPSKPFQKKCLFVPHLKEKNSLLLHFLKDVDIVMGIDFMELGSGLQFLYKQFTGETLNFPPLDLLTLHILSLIEEIPELKSYRDQKAQGLAEAIGKEFLRYGKFGYLQLESWKAKKGWQQRLWHKIFSTWDSPSKLLKTPFKHLDQSLEVHLYHFPFLPEITHRFFERLANYCPVHYYQFSPCSVFWTDIFSEKERLKVEKKISPKFRDEWTAYLGDRPLLLANFGGLSRLTFRFFEEAEFPLNECYDPLSKGTLLNLLQHEILHFKTPKKRDLPQIQSDESLILQSASSKRREVEILYQTLISLLNEHPYRLSDVQVYAPDISLYAPFISFIFGSKNSPFPFSLFDLPKNRESSLLQGFFKLLSLTKKRFKPAIVLSLFSHCAFKKRFSLSQEEIAFFAEWIEKEEIKWGIDKAQRNALFSGREMHEETESGTWEAAFSRTLLSFAKIPKERPTWDVPMLDFSTAETFGKCVSIVRSLREDLTVLETARFSLSNWANHLRTLLKRYFEVVTEDERASLSWVEEKLTLLESKNLPLASLSFEPIYHYLKKAFQEKSGRQERSQIEAIHFSSLKLGAIEHASVICLLGLDEEQFPRLTVKSSLCQLEIKNEPTTQEEDRHLLLEALFAAKSHLIMSYVNVNEEDGKEQAPSSLIQEFLAYLDRLYSLDQKKPSTIVKREHPPFFFHKSYFLEKRPGLETPYRVANQFYSPQTVLTPFIPEFLKRVSLVSSERETEDLFVEIFRLSQFARHPLRFYLNQRLNLYFEYREKDGEFALSPLNQMLLSHLASMTSFEAAFQEADQLGKLPIGRFKALAEQNSMEEIQALKSHLKKFNILEKTISSINLTLKIPLTEKRFAYLEGTLSNVTPEGLLFYGENKLSDILKVWPLFLIFASSNAPIKKHLLLAKSERRLTFPLLNAQKALASYLLYYERALTTPSPFMPNWALSFLEKGPDHLSKKIEATSDPYIQWIFRKGHYLPNVLFEMWSPLLKNTFKPLKQELFHENI